MTDHQSKRADPRGCGRQAGWVLLLALTAGCPWAGIPEALTPYDFQTDPDGDASLANARTLVWRGDTAIGVGGISIDPGNYLAMRSFLQGQEIIGNFGPPDGETDIFSLGRLEAGDEISLSHSSLTERFMLATPLGQVEFAEDWWTVVFILVGDNAEILGYPGAAPVVVQSEGEYYIIVTAAAELAAFDYTFTVTRRHNIESVPRRGVLLLDFDGATDVDITFPGGYIETLGDVVTVSQLPPFDLEQTRPDLPGQTERFRRVVRDLVEYIYADYNVLVTTDAAEAEAAGAHDTVVFTSGTGKDLGLEFEFAGVEPALDVEDQREQVGIITPAEIANDLPDDFNALCARWANVAAHEYGHAIGLLHVEQRSEGLMAYECRWVGGCQREVRALTRAPLLEGPSWLLQNPDAYLTRRFGRRDSAEAAAIRARVADLLHE